jgi:hypothetical protein
MTTTRHRRSKFRFRDLRIDPAAQELLDSAAMEPYMNLATALMGGKDTASAVEERYGRQCVVPAHRNSFKGSLQTA